MKRSGLVIGTLAAILLLSAGYLAGIPGISGLQKPGGPSLAGQMPDVLPEVVQPAATGTADPVLRTYPYVLRGGTGAIRLELDRDLYNRLAAGPPPAVCLAPVYADDPCPKEDILRYYRDVLDRPEERPYLDALVQAIRNKTNVRDDRARIAISLVQQIPYRYNQSYTTGNGNLRSPYLVLYDGCGICDEKSLLLAYLLRELGYGVVLFSFPEHQHMAVGIRSPTAYAYDTTGYAFIETTFPSIVTDDQGEYGDGGMLTGSPVIYPIADGMSFDSLVTEYTDAREFILLREQVRTTGSNLTGSNRTEAQSLYREYGLKTGTE